VALYFLVLSVQKLALEVNAMRAVEALDSSVTEANRQRVRGFRDILMNLQSKIQRHQRVMTVIDAALDRTRSA